MCRTMIQKKCGKGECTWKGPYEDETAHLKKCLYVEMKCKDCDNNFLKVNLPEHIKNECPNRIVPCPRCEYPNVFKNLNDHYNNDCYKTFVNCRRCDQQIIKAFETDHEKNECLLSTVTCKYRFVGCSHISQRENMIKHYADMREQHMAYLEHFFNMGNLSIVKPFEHPAKEIKFKTTDDTYIEKELKSDATEKEKNKCVSMVKYTRYLVNEFCISDDDDMDSAIVNIIGMEQRTVFKYIEQSANKLEDID
jgi:hypothetical protein